jgi:hypothetical protein
MGVMEEISDFHIRVVIEETPFHYYTKVQTDVVDETVKDPSFPSTPTRDFCIEHLENNVPTCVGNSPSDLDIRTNVGSAIVDDDYTVTADGSDKKYIKMAIARDDTSGDLEIIAFEKTTGEYGSTPSGKTLSKWLKEFSVVASGTALVEEEDFI